MSERPPELIVILGPTAGGKSELAVELAERLPGPAGAQIIGADSMQVYRHLDAGTAKPPAAMRQRVRHHLIDVVEPTQRFSVSDWLGHADGLIADLRSRGVVPIVVGGTNLYIRALLEGLFDGPPADQVFRDSLSGQPLDLLHGRLARVDPEAARRIDLNDRRRIVRALEVQRATGTPISALQRQWSDSPDLPYRHRAILIGLRWPVEELNRRINARVKRMFDPDDGGESLPDETRRLEAAGLLGSPPDPGHESPGGADDRCQAREALGYKQVLAALHGGDPRIESMEDACERTRILTRRFAKQQRTWLRRFRGVHWIPTEQTTGQERTARAVRCATGAPD